MTEFHRVWIVQCEAVDDIRRRFGKEDPVSDAEDILLIERIKELLLT